MALFAFQRIASFKTSLQKRFDREAMNAGCRCFVRQQRTETIEALQHVSDEWILKAVAPLLGLAAPIPQCRRRVLDSRLDALHCAEARTVSIADARKRLL